MKYWAYFAAKLAGIAIVELVLALVILNSFPRPAMDRFGHRPDSNFLNNIPYTFCVGAIWLVGTGLFSLAIRDQRHRCRTCLRRLIMPVTTGSWGSMLRLGRPTTEWICPFGHGTLIDEIQFAGNPAPDWQPHGDDIWKELESYDRAK